MIQLKILSMFLIILYVNIYNNLKNNNINEYIYDRKIHK
jgi:hypothetical protein